MKEVITLQFGSYANYTGAHFWNFQDELIGLLNEEPESEQWQDINPDVLYRMGEAREGTVTYVPRLLIYDLRGSLGAVRARGSLYGEPEPPDIEAITTWGGGKAVHKKEPVEKNAYLQSLDAEIQQPSEGHKRGTSSGGGGGDADVAGPCGDDEALVDELEEGVEYWTDYLKALLHPESVHEVEGVWQGVAKNETYGDGLEWLRSEEDRESVHDSVRKFAEECDHLQGFQLLVDVSGGFSPLAGTTLEAIADEYTTLPRLTLALKPPQTNDPGMDEAPRSSEHARMARALSDAAAFGVLARNSSVFVPAWRPSIGSDTFPQVSVNDSKPFQTSALFAAAFDALSTPYRLRTSHTAPHGGSPLGATDLRGLANTLCRSPSTNVAALSLAFPTPPISVAQSGGVLRDASRITRALVPLSPGVDASWQGTPLAEVLSLRGCSYAGSERSASISDVSAAINAALVAEGRGLCVRHLAVSQQPLAIPLPFPRIFRAADGVILRSVESASVSTRLSVSSALAPFLLGMSAMLNGKRKGRSSTVLDSWGIDAGDLWEYLHVMEETYAGRRSHEDSD